MYINFECPPLLYYIRSNYDTFAPGAAHISRSKIDYFDLLMVFSGTLHLWEDGKAFDISSGEFLVLEPNKKHYGYKPSSETTHYFWVHFEHSGNFTLSWEKPSVLTVDYFNRFLFCLPKQGVFVNNTALHEQLKELVSLHTYSNELQKHRQQILFQQLLPLLTHRKSMLSESLQVIQIADGVTRFIEEHFREDITSHVLSESFNFSAAYLSRCLKKVYGITPLDYLRKVRVENAKFQLTNTENPIEKIALDTGFNSASYFSRIFSKEVGASPIQYRNIYR